MKVALNSLKKILDMHLTVVVSGIYTLQLYQYGVDCVALSLTYLLTYLFVRVTYGRHDVKFIIWHGSCLLYPIAVLAVNEPSVNFAS